MFLVVNVWLVFGVVSYFVVDNYYVSVDVD